MIDERQEELAALAALDLLEGAERAAFDRETAANPELARRVAELRAVAAELAYAANPAEPPAGLKDRILASAAARPPSATAPAKVAHFPTLLPWAIAAGFALAAIWSGHRYGAIRAENSALADRAQSIAGQVRDLEGQLGQEKQEAARARAILAHELKAANDPTHIRVDLLPPPSGDLTAGLAVAVWNSETQKGVLLVSKLPAKPPGHDFQLWIIPNAPHAVPVSAGLVRFASGEATGRVLFAGVTPVSSVAKFAVSLERAGGAPSPNGPIVLLSE
jgi:anti-sigma-K factor RskA